MYLYLETRLGTECRNGEWLWILAVLSELSIFFFACTVSAHIQEVHARGRRHANWLETRNFCVCVVLSEVVTSDAKGSLTILQFFYSFPVLQCSLGLVKLFIYREKKVHKGFKNA